MTMLQAHKICEHHFTVTQGGLKLQHTTLCSYVMYCEPSLTQKHAKPMQLTNHKPHYNSAH